MQPYQGVLSLKRPLYKYVLAGLDFIAVNVALIAAGRMRSDQPLTLYLESVRANMGTEIVFHVIFGCTAVLIFQHLGLYKVNVFLSVTDQIARLFKGQLYALVALMSLLFVTKSLVIMESRLAVVYFGVLGFLGIAAARVGVFRRIFRFLTRSKFISRKVLIVGSGEAGRLMGATALVHNPYGLDLVGFLSDDVPRGERVLEDRTAVGRVKDVNRVVKEHDIQEIIVCLENVTYGYLLNILDNCRKSGANVKVVSTLFGIVPQKVLTERYGDVSIVNVGVVSFSMAQAFLKRAFDMVFTSVLLLVLLPLFILMALVIKIESKGPAILRQTRIGKNGRPFHFYKFRSMTLAGEDEEARKEKVAQIILGSRSSYDENGSTKVVNEERITSFGRLIRKTSMDELPQLFNVLRGDMSLVGPRPCLPYEWECYDEWHKRRLSVIPGCTGLWQVTARSKVRFEDMVILDLYYIQNRSFLLDLTLILRTIPVMLFGKGGL